MQHLGGNPVRSQRHSQRGDPHGALSAAHELSESLGAIATYVETARRLLARQTVQQDETIVEILDKASAQADRAAEAFRQLRTLLQNLPLRASEGDQAEEEPTTTRCDPR